MKVTNPKLYEINTRIWIKKFGQDARLCNIPDEYWKDLANKGFDYVWLMGIWSTSPSTIKKYCYEDFLVRSYDKALKDWKEEDIIGSPYAIDTYEVNPKLGDLNSLKNLKTKLNSIGLKLILDFVPNHFSADTSLLKSNPEIFLEVDHEIWSRDHHTYFKADDIEKYFAHGRDPFFPAWKDTVQVNFYSQATIGFLTDILLNISEYTDGVRCDMAMLPLENVFANTWSGVLEKMGYCRPACNFWQTIIKSVKEKKPDYIFIAETYWDLEYKLQQLGFDFTYDKRLLERLITGTIHDIKLHLSADINFQNKLVRFLENHDEERSITSLGKQKLMASAVMISTLPGMRFFYDGQLEGKKVKVPVQLGREPNEKPFEPVRDFYLKLLSISKHKIFNNGIWKFINVASSWDGNNTNRNILAWTWTDGQEHCLVCVNYSDTTSQCRIKLDVKGYGENLQMNDVLNDASYLRSSEEVYYYGLFVELKPYHSHIFFY